MSESIDHYLNRFRLLKARCFTQAPEHELVEMTVDRLDYTQYLRDMAQLVDRVRQVERLKAKKARTINDGIIVVPKGLKMPPIEQRKKRGFFCKFHGYLCHNTSHCVSFKDSVQKALDEGRLKFGDKLNKPMQIDTDPLKQADSMYVEISDVNVIEVAESVAESFGKPKNVTKVAFGPTFLRSKSYF
ncbi:hypothetical protein MTR_8g468880 [Medicago truncatula]|uniref:Uncharacterized protein n=1 Tax=Medicago truncatula TaxID=3880 RepID=A0A072TQZ4_MEDTR|nr:hypothetical protein MTR_8g468880 [Medicago truncatula]